MSGPYGCSVKQPESWQLDGITPVGVSQKHLVNSETVRGLLQDNDHEFRVQDSIVRISPSDQLGNGRGAGKE